MNDDDKLIVLGSVFVLGLAGFIAFFFLYPFPQQMQVSGRSWQRNQYIERWQENVHEGWDVPTGGVVIDQERKKRGSYECGDSTCYRYDDWYTYKIWEWTETHFIYTKGQENAPFDPDLRPGYGQPNQSCATRTYHSDVHGLLYQEGRAIKDISIRNDSRNMGTAYRGTNLYGECKYGG